MRYRLALTLSLIALSGCSSNEMLYYLTHPNVESNSPTEAAVYVGAAIIVGEIQGECEHGHPEDQIKCKNKRDKSKN